MAYQNPITLKFSILIIVILAFEAREITSYSRVTVTIINAVAKDPYPTNITLHCKSKDDDLGFHTLKLEESYMFSFKPRFPFGTLFFCSFTWKESPNRHYIDIYDFKRDRCKNCRWRMNKDGGCRDHDGTGSFDVCIPWKSVELMDVNNTTSEM
ncbi:putative plant self-incompatibility S1 [Medicago truncatula]|uniref:S-protein homolog n=1 Tax=Medicago truncatula TaxID=3880 RepID=A0A072TZF6_MEDTR|nr:leguminosin group486 secreted peptide [Medicago truncatula]RHN45798.1 putative plant self-incompatibility S1 [Medicago truncatula]